MSILSSGLTGSSVNIGAAKGNKIREDCINKHSAKRDINICIFKKLALFILPIFIGLAIFLSLLLVLD